MDDTTQLVRAVGRIEGMLGALTTQLTQAHTDNNNRFAALETRLAAVEGKMSRILGIGAMLMVLVNVAAYWIRALFGH